jgi:Uma2 family endonuclease
MATSSAPSFEEQRRHGIRFAPEEPESAETEELYYPESDGEPMAETDVHIDQITDLRKALQNFYRETPSVYVSGTIMLYYEEGRTDKCVSPDLLVAKGIGRGQRRTYKVWEEGKSPDFVMEVTSDKTYRNDLTTKYALYEQVMKVPEYFLFDPLDKNINPQLQGYQLEDGVYVPIEAQESALYSQELELAFHVVEGMLRAYDPIAGELLMTPDELADAFRAETLARQAEAQRRQEAESELERLRAELAELKKQQS